MFRAHWRDPGFWRWWWANAPKGLRVGAGIVLLVLVLGAGLLTAGWLGSAKAEVATGAYTYETTIQKVITIREHGTVVRKVVPVIKKVFVRPSTAFETRTAYDTRTVTTPGGVKTVQRQVVKYVPVVKKHVVTVAGKTHTIAVTTLIPTTKTVTQTQRVTNQQTVTTESPTTVEKRVTDTHTVTNEQTVTDVETQTQTQTQTVTQTETQPAVTVTVPVTVVQTTTVVVTTTVDSGGGGTGP